VQAGPVRLHQLQEQLQIMLAVAAVVVTPRMDRLALEVQVAEVQVEQLF
jgi:hypothetical protein